MIRFSQLSISEYHVAHSHTPKQHSQLSYAVAVPSSDKRPPFISFCSLAKLSRMTFSQSVFLSTIPSPSHDSQKNSLIWWLYISFTSPYPLHSVQILKRSNLFIPFIVFLFEDEELCCCCDEELCCPFLEYFLTRPSTSTPHCWPAAITEESSFILLA